MAAKTVGKASRKAISLATKQALIKDYNLGLGIKFLCDKYSIVRTTVNTIIKNKDALEKMNVTDSSTRLFKGRETIVEMERLLERWISEKQFKGESLTQAIICKKAKTIFSELVRNSPSTSNNRFDVFNASNGWYTRFKKRSGFKTKHVHVHVQEEFAEKDKFEYVHVQEETPEKDKFEYVHVQEETPEKDKFEYVHVQEETAEKNKFEFIGVVKEERVYSHQVLNPVEKVKEPSLKTKNTEETVAISQSHKANSEYDHISIVWANELQKMSKEQQIFAKKAINEILYEGQLGNLNRNTFRNSRLTYQRPSNRINSEDSVKISETEVIEVKEEVEVIEII